MKFILPLFFISLSGFSQIDSIGSGHAISFDGVNDYIEIGSHYHNLSLPISASAWIKFEQGATSLFPIFVTNDNTNFMYRGFWFYATPTELLAEIGDGAGGYNPAFRRGLAANFPDVTGRWVHVGVVMRSPSDVSLYLNGNDVGGFLVGDSSLPMATSYSNDTAKIGYQYTNAGTIYRSKASLDEVRVWNRALTQDEVKKDMCRKITGSETGLIGYWNFDEISGDIIYDKSPNHFDGKLKYNPQRVFSGAPIGDVSTYQYTSNWTGKTLSLADGTQKLDVLNITGSPDGVQLYEVKSVPSQQGGLDASHLSTPYFGVFMASVDADNTFTANLSSSNTACSSSIRFDNSVATWASSSVPVNNLLQQQELIFNTGVAPKPNLGADVSLCDVNNYFIDSHINPANYQLKWSTGATTQGITVTQTNLYWLEVIGACSVSRDSVYVTFMSSPPDFTLGSDVQLCNVNQYTIDSHLDANSNKLLWSNGSTSQSIVVTNSGWYWLEAQGCKNKYDSIFVTFSTSPPSFSFGPDQSLCNFEPSLLKPMDNPTGFTFQWQNGSTRNSFDVKDYGTYWVEVINGCGSAVDTIRFVRPELDISKVPNVITPNGDSKNDYYKIQDDLKGELTFQVFNRWGEEVFRTDNYNNNWDGADLANGVYFVILSGSCIGSYKTPMTIIR